MNGSLPVATGSKEVLKKNTDRFGGEIQRSEIAVVFFSGAVLCCGGADLVLVAEEEYPSAVEIDLCLPRLFYLCCD